MPEQSAKYTILFTVVLLSLCACNTTKYLDDGEALLVGNDIELNSKGNVDQKRALTYQLTTLYKQTENSNFLFIPREWFYFATGDPGDTTKLDRWQRRVIAEEPAIYDPELRKATAQSMTYFLQRQGYFNAMVKDTVKIRRKKAKVTYEVYPFQQFTIDTVHFKSEDTIIHQVLQDISYNSHLKEGRGIDGKLYERERDRVSTYLRNHGYAYFYNTFIQPLSADTTVTPKRAQIYFEVSPPFEDSLHQAYRVGQVEVFLDYIPGAKECCVRDTTIGDVVIYSSNDFFRVKPKTLYDAVYLHRGEVFSQANYDKTNQQMSSLGVFRFVRMKKSVDSIQPNLLNIRVELTSQKRMEIGFDLTANFASRNASGAGNLIGLEASPSLRNRNLLRGAELLITDFSAGVEFNPAPTAIASGDFWNTVDLRFQSSMLLPRFTDYLGLWRLTEKLTNRGAPPDEGSEEQSLYDQVRENATTRISASYNYLLIRDFYQYDLFTATYGFDFQRSANQRLLVNHVGIDYLSPRTLPRFDSLLLVNPFLERSFGEQLFASFLFRDLNYVFNSRTNRRGNSYYVGYILELAGAEVWGGNVLYNAFVDEPDTLRLRLGRNATDFSQYVRTEVDLRRYWQSNRDRNVAARFAFGIARPFGYTSDVPYVKQFFAGGPVSVRAWAPRGLGPGAYEDPLSRNIQNNTRLYQTGDIRIEANLEYRFKIFWLLNGALFLDAGNVWTIERDPNRCGSQFLLSADEYDCVDEFGKTIRYVNEPFYRQIAVGGGMGFRFDFSYFILRLDLATKLRHSYPYLPDESGAVEGDYWLRDFREGYGLSKVAFNLGFGYPF